MAVSYSSHREDDGRPFTLITTYPSSSSEELAVCFGLAVCIDNKYVRQNIHIFTKCCPGVRDKSFIGLRFVTIFFLLAPLLNLRC